MIKIVHASLAVGKFSGLGMCQLVSILSNMVFFSLHVIMNRFLP